MEGTRLNLSQIMESKGKRWIEDVFRSNDKASVLTIVMLTISILFKSFKRVYIDEISMVFSIFFLPCLWKGNFHFPVKLLAICSEMFSAIYLTNLQETMATFHTAFAESGWLCRVRGEGEHHSIASCLILIIFSFTILCYVLLNVCLSCLYSCLHLFFIHQFI